MNNVSRRKMGFEDWLELAKTNPEAFEAKRQEAVEAAISNAPANIQPRLRGLQWRVDRTRDLASSPVSSMMAISNMMWDNYHYLNGLLHHLAKPAETAKPVHTATVLPFRERELVSDPANY